MATQNARFGFVSSTPRRCLTAAHRRRERGISFVSPRRFMGPVDRSRAESQQGELRSNLRFGKR
jgi:hypothetical protein